jgi:pyruvate,water dikinase
LGQKSGKLRRELKELVGAEDADSLLSSVGLDDELLASLGPVVGLARVARGEMSREAYLEQWGHRDALETELSVPRPAEDAEWLDRQLARISTPAAGVEPVNAEALLSRQRERFEAAWTRFQERYPRQVKPMRRRLEAAAEAERIREAVRSEGARLVWVGRDCALRAGELTGIGEGVFHLLGKELLDLLQGQDRATAHIPARRRTYERYQALPPYPLLIRGRFDPFAWAEDPDRREDVYDASGLLQQYTLQPPSEKVVLGMPGSAGQAEGRVRRLSGPEEGEALQPGEVLVAAQTNIGWTLFFPKAAAVVTDVGAPLSHAAIVARELGIPAVVNCGDATRRLETGMYVRVDGTQGTVTILD